MLQLPKLKAYLAAMERRGFSTAATLATSGVQIPDLSRRNLVLTRSQTQTIIRNMLALTNNAALGFEIGSEVTISGMGLLGHAMIAAPNFRQTIALWKRFAAALYGSLLELNIGEEQHSSQWSLHIGAPLPQDDCYRFFIEEYLALAVTMGKLMSATGVTYTSVQLQYPAPEYAQLYSTLYDCPVYFGAESNKILIKRPRLDDPIDSRDEHLFEIYRHYCQRQSRQLAQQGDINYQLHHYLLQNLGQTPTLAAAASELGYSSRTLKRRLAAEGHCFRNFVAEFRQDFARENLGTSAMTIKEVAYLLGYRDTKPLLRAFKRWTGKTVGQYRQNN